MKRFTALILLCALLLSGCSSGGTLAASPSPEATAPAASPTPTPPAKLELSDDTLIMTVGDSPVYWDEFRYWMFSSLQYLGYTPGNVIEWDSVNEEGETLAAYVVRDATQAIRLYRTIEARCAQMNVELTEEDLKLFETSRAENVEYYGGEQGYQDYLHANYLTDEIVDYLLRVSSLYYRLFVEMYGENAEKLRDAQALAYGEENGYYRAKHILLSATDELGEARSEEEYAALHTRMEEMLAQLRAAEDPVALFDELMRANSEDGGLAAYPDGYQFVTGDMVPEFQAAVEALDDYEISDIVEMSYGWTIIMRLPLDPDEVSINDYYGYTLRYNAATAIFQTLAASWTEEQPVTYAPVYETIDPTRVFVVEEK